MFFDVPSIVGSARNQNIVHGLMEIQTLQIDKRKRRLVIPKNLSIVDCWNKMGPLVSKEIGGPEYTAVPYLTEVNAFKIGHIFVQSGSKSGCFGRVPILKVLGPIKSYVVKSETNPSWQTNTFPTIKTTSDYLRLKVRMYHGEKEIVFTALDYYYLSKPDNMVTENNVTIDRSSHEDLTRAKWVGLISGVVVAKVFEINIKSKLLSRVFYVADADHTVLFKYELGKMNLHGGIVRTKLDKKKKVFWKAARSNVVDTLPLVASE